MIVQIKPWRREIVLLSEQLEQAIREYTLLEAVAVEKVDVELVIATQDRVNFELERLLFYSALGCRRMLEAARWAGSRERSLSNVDCDSSHDFISKDGSRWPLSWRELFNEIIHSKKLSWSEQPSDGFDGFWIASDRKTRRGEVHVYWDQYLATLHSFACVPCPSNATSEVV